MRADRLRFFYDRNFKVLPRPKFVSSKSGSASRGSTARVRQSNNPLVTENIIYDISKLKEKKACRN
ncbi:hypothetical protein ACVWYQ_002537 [Bradyrhizobium sp. USDA 3397]